MNNVYTYSPLDRVIWDTPSLEAIESEIERLNAKKVFIVSSSLFAEMFLRFPVFNQFL